jgi:hypothetical protein
VRLGTLANPPTHQRGKGADTRRGAKKKEQMVARVSKTIKKRPTYNKKGGR